MNIFYLDRETGPAARYHCDRHVTKMILEYAQLLSTAHRVIDPAGAEVKGLYRATHTNHPSAVWARAGLANYRWLVALLERLLAEYRLRYGRTHATARLLPALAVPPTLPDTPFTDPPQAMPETFRGPDTVEAYRAYYRGPKAGFARWTNRPVPAWFAA